MSKNKINQSKILWSLLFTFLFTRFFLWAHINPMFQGPDELPHLAMIAQIDRNGFHHYKNPAATTWLDFENSYDYKDDYYQQANVVARYDNRPKYAPSGVWGIQEKERIHRPNFDDTAW